VLIKLTDAVTDSAVAILSETVTEVIDVQKDRQWNLHGAGRTLLRRASDPPLIAKESFDQVMAKLENRAAPARPAGQRS
jgi:hypothetical protein